MHRTGLKKRESFGIKKKAGGKRARAPSLSKVSRVKRDRDSLDDTPIGHAPGRFSGLASPPAPTESPPKLPVEIAASLEAEGSSNHVIGSLDVLMHQFQEYREESEAAIDSIVAETQKHVAEKDGLFQSATAEFKKFHHELVTQLKASRERELELELKVDNLTQQLENAGDRRQREDTNMLRFYTALTTLQMLPSPKNDPNFVIAVLKAPGKNGFKFQIGLSADDRFEYSPIKNSFSAQLPDYLKDEIEFNVEQAPVFFSKILHFYLSNTMS